MNKRKEVKILGIELGSTSIKAVLINEKGVILSQGVYEWENKFENGFWTYDLEEVWKGVQVAYAEVVKGFGKKIKALDAVGVSAMMHGYLAFDKNNTLLTPFRTWRNTTTLEASEILTQELSFNMPQRWTATHFYQAILNGEPHVKRVSFLTTLAGYVHWKLTGKKVLGIGDASGIFPINGDGYDRTRLTKYNTLLRQKGITTPFQDMLPEILHAGENAGYLTKEGAALLDPSGTLGAGALCCPPEGEAGTSMVATNSVREKTGNVSASASGVVMVVMKKKLSKVYPEIDVVMTPSGNPVAMVRVNNCIWENLSSFTGEAIENNEMQTYSAFVALHLEMRVLEEEKVQIKEFFIQDGLFKAEDIGAKAMSVALNAPVAVMKTAGEDGAWGIALLALYAVKETGTLEEFLKDLFRDVQKTIVKASEEEKQKFKAFMINYEKDVKVEKLATEIF